MYRNRRFYLTLVLMTVCCLGACSNANKNVGTAKKEGAATGSPTSALTKLTPASVTSSTSTPTDPPANAVDGDLNTQWISGSSAPQWLQLDLGQEYLVSKVRLNILQTPPGPTTHQVFGGPTPETLTLIGILDDITQDNQWLEFYNSVDHIRYLKIETVRSPSWVAWREIEVYK